MKGLAIIYRPHMLWSFSGSERRFVSLSRHLKNYDISFDSLEPYPPLNFFMQTSHTPYTVKQSNSLYMNLIEWLIIGTARVLGLKRTERYDFVYATNNNLYNILLGITASRLLSIPLIIVVHHLRWVDYLDSEEPPLFKFGETYALFRDEGLNPFASLARTCGAYLENNFLKMADALITVSKTVASQLSQSGCNRRIFVDGNGIDEKYYERKAKLPKAYDAIYVGRIDEGKGVFDLLEVWKKIKAQLPGAKLIIVGTGTLYSQVEASIKNKDLDRNVKLVGSVSDRDLLSFFLSSRIFVTLSKVEGWGLTIGEALANGLPVVCYDLPTLREVYGACNSVRLIPPGHLEQAADEIARLLKTKEPTPNRLDEVTSFVHGLSWKEVARLENIAIRSVVNRN